MVIDQVLCPLSVAPLAIVNQNEKCRKEGDQHTYHYVRTFSVAHHRV